MVTVTVHGKAWINGKAADAIYFWDTTEAAFAFVATLEITTEFTIEWS